MKSVDAEARHDDRHAARQGFTGTWVRARCIAGGAVEIGGDGRDDLTLLQATREAGEMQIGRRGPHARRSGGGRVDALAVQIKARTLPSSESVVGTSIEGGLARAGNVVVVAGQPRGGCFVKGVRAGTGWSNLMRLLRTFAVEATKTAAALPAVAPVTTATAGILIEL